MSVSMNITDAALAEYLGFTPSWLAQTRQKRVLPSAPIPQLMVMAEKAAISMDKLVKLEPNLYFSWAKNEMIRRRHGTTPSQLRIEDLEAEIKGIQDSLRFANLSLDANKRLAIQLSMLESKLELMRLDEDTV